MTENHLTPGELAAYAERRLPAANLLSASDHLAECAQCREQLIQVVGSPSALESTETSLTLSYPELAGWLDDELDPITRREVAATLARSAQARAELANLARFRSEMDALPQRDHANDVAAPEQRRAAVSRWVFALAAAVLLSGAAVWWMASSGSAPADFVKLHDGGRVLGFAEDGRARDLPGLPQTGAEWVADAVRTGRIDMHAENARLAGQMGTLAGPEEERSAFRVLAPLATAVADPKPRFRWSAAAGASAYQINVVEETSGAVILSERLPGETPEWAPATPLPSGEVYQWEVQALHEGQVIANTPAPPQPEARFRVLAEAAVAELEEAKRASGGSEFVMGVANARAGLVDDALQNFRALAKQNPDSALVKQLIAQLESERTPKR